MSVNPPVNCNASFLMRDPGGAFVTLFSKFLKKLNNSPGARDKCGMIKLKFSRYSGVLSRLNTKRMIDASRFVNIKNKSNSISGLI